jgi:hypothetical protein
MNIQPIYFDDEDVKPYMSFRGERPGLALGYIHDTKDFETFIKKVKFICAEWGASIQLMTIQDVQDEDDFKQMMQGNFDSSQKACITLGDMARLLFKKLKIPIAHQESIKFILK